MSNRPRRNIPPVNYAKYDYADTGYPEGPAVSSLEKLMHKLNKQSFPSASLGRVDDILVYTLFASKRKENHYRTFIPERVSEVEIDAKMGLGLHQVVKEFCENAGSPNSQLRLTSQELIATLPALLKETDRTLIEHLLQRYHMLLSSHSLVRLEKVSFDGRTIHGGVKAAVDILPDTFLLTLCSSMSSDTVNADHGLSLIQASPSQLPPHGVRMILGPFRFVNHDCDPNCQIRWIAGSHAYTMITLRSIKLGESITVSYSAQGYGGYGGGACKCATCNPSQLPVARKRSPRPQLQRLPWKKKETRRGGVGRKRKKGNLKAPECPASGEHSQLAGEVTQ